MNRTATDQQRGPSPSRGVELAALTEFGWALVWPKWDRLSGRPMIWTVRGKRSDVVAVVGEAWAKRGETVAQGWRRAYASGYRARRVLVCPAPEETDQRDGSIPPDEAQRMSPTPLSNTQQEPNR